MLKAYFLVVNLSPKESESEETSMRCLGCEALLGDEGLLVGSELVAIF